MAPPKVLLGQNRQNSTNLRKGVTTRSQNALLNNVVKQSVSRDTRKRKAEASPPKEKTVKRSAFTNITNVCNILYYNYIIRCKYTYSTYAVFLS